jgi:DNA-binding beta-propeller fold protein YncE
VSIVAFPQQPNFNEQEHFAALSALIEEARRHARRRRRRVAAVMLLAAAAVGAAIIGFRGGGLSSPGKPLGAVDAAPRVVEFAGSPLRPAGELTLLGVQFDFRGEGRAGWYGLSTVEGAGCVAGCLKPLVRCPRRVDWCGQVESLDWSRDGQRLALSVTSYGTANPYNGIHVIDVASGRDRHIIPRNCCDWFDLAWSPDGSRLAYATRGQIYVLEADGSRQRALPTGTDGHDSSPTWSADGTQLAFATRPGKKAPAEIHLIRLDGSDRRLLAPHASAPAWSPDGSRIAYTDRCGGIKLITPTGADATPASLALRCRVIGAPGRPTWSPDGSRIAVAAAAGIYVMNRDGTQLALVTTERGRGVTGHPDLSWAPALNAD